MAAFLAFLVAILVAVAAALTLLAPQTDLTAGNARGAREDICNAQVPNRPNFVDSVTICRD